jgi:hypothetical protein
VKKLKLEVIQLDGLTIKEAQDGKSKFQGCRVNISFDSPNIKKLVQYPVGIIESNEEKILLGNELKLKQNSFIKPSLNLYQSDDYDHLEDSQIVENDISKEIKSHPKVMELREINSKLKLGDRNAFEPFMEKLKILPKEEYAKHIIPQRKNQTIKKNDLIKEFIKTHADAGTLVKKSKSILLSFPNQNLPFVLKADASNAAGGAELFQLVSGKKNLISFHSFSFSGTQRSWSIPKKEAYAALKAVKKFLIYIDGQALDLLLDSKI